eukprot:gb/GECG01009630.1/.p1 GENE.gb/GECG01009630.1/~~gb/GECG01009630.1/.p1  ORF type:complete len:100 (+),score=8.75 gb/GECG01009630.1/:1-300(+)
MSLGKKVVEDREASDSRGSTIPSCSPNKQFTQDKKIISLCRIITALDLYGDKKADIANENKSTVVEIKNCSTGADTQTATINKATLRIMTTTSHKNPYR